MRLESISKGSWRAFERLILVGAYFVSVSETVLQRPVVERVTSSCWVSKTLSKKFINVLPQARVKMAMFGFLPFYASFVRCSGNGWTTCIDFHIELSTHSRSADDWHLCGAYGDCRDTWYPGKSQYQRQDNGIHAPFYPSSLLRVKRAFTIIHVSTVPFCR